MLDVAPTELLLLVVVAVVVIGPKDLPRVLYKLGQILGKGRAMTRHFRAGIDEMIRQAEMEEMEKKWAADNARIMAQTQAAGSADPATTEPVMTPVEPATPPPPPAFQVDPAQAAPAADPSAPAPSEPTEPRSPGAPA